MTTSSIRQKLITYLADADDNKVRAIYTLLKNDIFDGTNLVLTDEQWDILDMEQEMHFKGISKSYNRKEAIQIIKGERTF